MTVIIDLTPVREKTGPSRLLDIVEGRSKALFKTWLAARQQAWRDGVEVVAMDGFTGLETAASEELPDAVTVMRLIAIGGSEATGFEQAAGDGMSLSSLC